MDAYSILIIAVFIGTLIAILSEKIDKTAVSLLSALIVLYILSQSTKISIEDAFKLAIEEFIDFPTLVIMFSILIVGTLIGETGVFQWLAIKLVKLTRGDSNKLLMVLVILTVIMSSFLTIIAAAIIMSKLTISIARALDINPKPYMIAEATSISIGGLTSLIASPASILISQEVGLTFLFFTINTLPLAILLAVVAAFTLLRILQIPKKIPEIRRAVILEFDEWSVVPSKRMFYVTIFILIGMTVGFLIFPAFIVSFAAALLFLILTRKHFDAVAHEIEWSDILFFIGMFTIIGGIEYTGILEAIGHELASLSGGNALIPLVLILWISGISSGFLDEVTIALTFLPIIREVVAVGGFDNYFIIFVLALILSTNLGGCMTPIGTPANLLIISTAKSEGEVISFTTFLRIGAIIVFMNLMIATLYVILLSLFVT
ncbi:MAG: SLC13 family permease [Candidatus Asgardarchaeia archaeon]